MKTLLNFVNEIQNICNLHPNVNAAYYGDDIQLDDKQQQDYPIAMIQPEPIQMGTGFLTYNVMLTILANPRKDRSNDLEVDSQLTEIIADIIGEISNSTSLVEYNVESDLTVNPINPTPDYNNRVLGWQVLIPAIVKYQKTGCDGSIINPIEGEGIGTAIIESTFIVA